MIRWDSNERLIASDWRDKLNIINKTLIIFGWYIVANSNKIWETLINGRVS